MKTIDKICLLSIISLFTFSCNPVTNTPNPTSTNAVTSAEVSKGFVESFDPPLKVGQKYTYIIKNSINADTEEVSTEVLQLEGSNITARVSSSKQGTSERVGTIADFSVALPDSGITNLGEEDLKLPAGEYKKTVKVSYFSDYSNGVRTKFTLWLVKNIGAVKIEEIQPDFKVITSELKEFKEG